MARNRLSAITSLIDGFNGMYDTIGRVQKDLALREIADATPQEIPGANPPPNQAVVDTMTANDGGYPEAAAINAATGGPRGPSAYSFLGQTQDKPFDDASLSRARQLAMAGALERYGDVEGGSRLRNTVRQLDMADAQLGEMKARGAREAALFPIQLSNAERDARRAQADEDYRKAATDLYANTSIGRKQASYTKAMDTYNADKAKYDKAVEAGDTTATPPPMPQRPNYTPAEMLQDTASALALKVEHGRASPEELIGFADKFKQVNDEGYIQSLRLAQSGAPLTAVVAAFNQQGKVQLDPSSIVSDKMVTREGGVKSRIITYRAPDGTTQSIDTFAELDGLGKAKDLFDRAVSMHTMANQDRQTDISAGHLAVSQGQLALSRAATAAAAPERDLKSKLAGLQLDVVNAKTPESRAAATAKLTDVSNAIAQATGGNDTGADPADVKKARALVAAAKANGQDLDLGTALDTVINKPDKAHQEFVQGFMKNFDSPDQAVKKADDVMKGLGWVRSGNRWTKSGGAPAAGAKQAPQKGTVVDGYEYTGGPGSDPNDQKNWRKK